VVVLWALCGLAGCAGEPSAEVRTTPVGAVPPPTSSASPRQPSGAGREPSDGPAASATAAAAGLDTCAPLAVELPDVPMGADDVAIPAIERPALLTPFFERAARLMRGRASEHVRIAVYGDSNLTEDFMTGRMRRWLQKRHGDAGHGFVALGRPWAHYRHLDVVHGVHRGFEMFTVTTNPTADGMYGLAVIAAASLYQGASTSLSTAAPDAPIGQRVSRLEVYFLRGKRYGRFNIRVDGKPHDTVDARASELGLGRYQSQLSDAAHRIEVRDAHPTRRVRLLGAVLERDSPSFVVDSFGVGALNSRAMAAEDPAINRAMLEARGYALEIFLTGANDVFTMDVTPKHLSSILKLHREALGHGALLVATPPDRGKYRTFPLTRQAVAQREQIARDNGVAFWNLWRAMGGEGSMARFRARGLARSDYVHFNQAGSGYMADRLMHALFSAMRGYLESHPNAGCAP
jgi:lysophospholipase L1-like esterase